VAGGDNATSHLGGDLESHQERGDKT